MNSPQPLSRGIIFDLGDVLFTWSANTSTSIPARTVKAILSTEIWHSYERGEISRDNCYELSSQKFSLPMSEIAEAFVQSRKSLQPNDRIVALLRDLKKDSAIKVYAMSNVGKEDFEDLATKMDWPLFDQVFTSAAAGMRKPEPKFYSHVLEKIGLAGNQVTFVDDKEENVHAAQTLGIRCFVFRDTTVPLLREMFDSPVGRGWRCLIRNAKQCDSVTSNGVAFADNFAKLLVADLLDDHTLADLSWGSKNTWNFFAALVPGGVFPDDLDTTSLALKVLRPSSGDTISLVLDTMTQYVNDDGTFQTYYDRDRVRVDPIVSANVLACFYSFERGHEFERTLQLLHTMLLDRSYAKGTRYYPSPDCCLGFIDRLLRSSRNAHLQTSLAPLLASRLRERLGMSGDALDLAMRVKSCTHMGIACEDDRSRLLDMQCEDGGWEGGWIYRYGSTGVKVGNRGVTTAVAVAALSAC
ncbi:HAD-like protein [Nemania sp. NC0429]|nr:HAD-like protein [Nemania sp. NC0429]